MKADISKIQGETHKRAFSFERSTVDEAKRTIELAFSSEEPYERWWGKEILDHSNGACDLTRLNGGGALLLEHDPEKQIGVVESARIDSDRKGRAVVRFSKSPLGEEIFQDVKDGIRRLVSVGYRLRELITEKVEEGVETLRATRWEPLEISIVSIPADPTVGVGRNTTHENESMKKNILLHQSADIGGGAPAPAPAKGEGTATVTRDAKEFREMYEIAKRTGKLELYEKALERGLGVEEFRKELVNTWSMKPIGAPAIGLNEQEKRSFNLMRAINALANPKDARAQEDAAFEFEVSLAAQEKAKRQSRGLMIPTDILTRDLTVGTAADGGHLKGTNLLGGSFINRLTNKLVVKQAGATVLSGLVGSVAIPRMATGATAYWVGENSNLTESQQTFEQATLAPKSVGAMTDLSRKLILQSTPSAQQLVENDLMLTLALAIDLAGLHGTGASNQPTGIAATSGIGSVAGGTNGLAPAWSHIVGLETEVSNDNADIGALAYITNAAVRGKLKQTEKASSTGQFIWQDSSEPGVGMMNGYRSFCSNQVSRTLTKGSSSGVCSAIFFGNWADLVIGEWGNLDLLVDPYTGGAAGTVRVRVFQDVDIAVRHPESFSAMLDALTS